MYFLNRPERSVSCFSTHLLSTEQYFNSYQEKKKHCVCEWGWYQGPILNINRNLHLALNIGSWTALQEIGIPVCLAYLWCPWMTAWSEAFHPWESFSSVFALCCKKSLTIATWPSLAAVINDDLQTKQKVRFCWTGGKKEKKRKQTGYLQSQPASQKLKRFNRRGRPQDTYRFYSV